MAKGAFCFIALCFLVLSCNAQDAPHTQANVDIKEGLKAYLLSHYDDIKISEVYSKNDNKKAYLEKSLGDALVKEVVDIQSHDIYFRELSATAEVHLGIAYLRYDTQEQAQKAMAQIEQKGFFENTKILTRYIITNIDAQNVILYTESAANKMVLEYLDIASSKLKKL
ncbi:hypothetical protein ACSV5M_10185 [Cellvibrio sp. ARAG 10.3]|uniref:hypothetical protein n=1 Tax=Cellvibrio sp. ARAG 10.3 TaxID=3451358 RepID=UPI003F47EB4F